MKNKRHALRRMTYGAAFLALFAGGNLAQAATCPEGFPNRPINFFVGYAAGGGTDVIGRAIASSIERQQGWTVVTDNRPGAGGGTLSLWLKSQQPDGYTIGVIGTDSVALTPVVSDVDFTWEDFDYLGSGMLTWTGMAALTDAPFDDLPGFLDYAREKGRATISVAGVNQEILLKQLSDEFGVDLVPIPGGGASEAMASALGGHVDATTQGTLHIAQIKAGTMKLIVSLVDRRVPYAPDIGTLSEYGSNTPATNAHTTLIAPLGLPEAIHTCLAEAIDEAVNSPEYAVQMATFDNEALNLGPEAARELTREQAEFYERMLAAD